MSAFAKGGEGFGAGAARGEPAIIEPTHWGYVLPGKDIRGWMGPVLRPIAVFCGVSLVFAAVGLWCVPGSDFSSEVLPFKLDCSAFFLLLGTMLVQLGQELGRPEIQVDLHRSEIRIVNRGSDGVVTLEQMFRFEEIEEVDIADGRFRLLGPNCIEIAAYALAEASERERCAEEFIG